MSMSIMFVILKDFLNKEHKVNVEAQNFKI